MITLDTGNLAPFVGEEEILSLRREVARQHRSLEQGTGAGAGFLGWLHLAERTKDAAIRKIETAARRIGAEADALVVIGIGGSYLGARAALEFLGGSFGRALRPAGAPEVYFAGQQLSGAYLNDLQRVLAGKRLFLNVISKSGTTLEPALAFRVLRRLLEKRHGKKEASRRIIATTDAARGTLRSLARREGWTTFAIPDGVGGRYSVLTPVGLLPIAAAGYDIRALLAGAKAQERLCARPSLAANPAYRYATARNLLYRRGRVIELLATMEPDLHYVAEWWKQLAGESEGKDNRGIFPAAADLTTDLHSLGQLIQEGTRNLFETFLTLKRDSRRTKIPKMPGAGDGLDYLAGRDLAYVNRQAWRGTARAHYEGRVPNLTIQLAERGERALGALFIFFMRAIALSGYLGGVNPFDQPGVEAYKRAMYQLLGKK